MDELLQQEILHLGNYQLTILDLLKLTLIFLGTHLFLAFVLHWFSRLVERRNYDTGRAHSISLLIKYFIWILAVLFMLSVIGIEPSVLIASSAALFVGLGFGLQGIFKDIVSGIFLLFEGTIEVGDVLEVDKIIGRIDQIYLRTTKIITREGVSVIIPNSKIISENVINWTHHNRATKVQLPILLPYKADAQSVIQTLQAIAQQAELRNSEVEIAEFTEKFIRYELAFYTTEVFEVENLKSKLRLEIIKALTDAGIALPG